MKRRGKSAVRLPEQRPQSAALWMLLPAMAAVLAHVEALGGGFVNWDDHAYLHNNPSVTSAGGLIRMWIPSDLPQFYPLTFALFWIEHKLWGFWAGGFHAVSLALHAASAALLVQLLTRLGLSVRRAAVVALLFAIAPIQVMSVAWISETKNTLSTLLAIISLLAWARHCESGTRQALAASLLAFAATLLAKSAWAGLPLVMFVQAALVHRVPRGRAARTAALFVPLSIAAAFVTMQVEQGYIDEDVPRLEERLAAAPAAFMLYAIRALAPLDLAPFYPRWEASFASLRFWGPLAIAAAALAAWIAARRRISPAQHWGAVLWCVSLAPVLGFLPFGNMAATWVSDHFAYYACIGLFVIVVTVVADATQAWFKQKSQAASVLLATAVSLAYFVQTQRQIPTWRSSETLWRRVLETQPNSWIALAGLAQAHLERRDIPAAIADYRRALAVRPNLPEFRAQLASLLAMTGQLEAAEAEYRRAIQDEPALSPARDALAELLFARGAAAADKRDYAAAIALYEQAIAQHGNIARYWNNLGQCHLQLGSAAAAIAKISRAVELDPRDAPAWNNLGIAYSVAGDPNRAIDCLQRATLAAPDYSAAYDRLATALTLAGRCREADETLTRALPLVAADARPLLMLRQARLLASAPDADARDPRRALALATEVVQASGGRRPDALDTLAMARASLGQFDEAVRLQQQAIAIWRSVGPPEPIPAAEERLIRYRARKPPSEP